MLCGSQLFSLSVYACLISRNIYSRTLCSYNIIADDTNLALDPVKLFTLIIPVLSMSKFCGLRSRCRILLWWQQRMALLIWYKQLFTTVGSMNWKQGNVIIRTTVLCWSCSVLVCWTSQGQILTFCISTTIRDPLQIAEKINWIVKTQGLLYLSIGPEFVTQFVVIRS